MTAFITRREALALGAGIGALGFSGLPALAQQRFFRIGTGGTGGTYYPVGGLIANAVSTDKINVSAVATNGSVANVNGIVGGSMESGFSQADINAWAYTGTGIYEGKPKIEELRVIANLYPESVHVVVKKGAGIKSLADLKGKRVSLDEPGSGTLVNARALLAAYGVTERDIRPEYLKQVQCAEKLKDGSLDAYFQTTGYPQGTLSELAATNGFELLPIDGAERDKIMAQYKFFAKDKIPDGVYKDVKGVETIAVGAQWTTSSKQPDDLVYEITKALWSDKTRAALDAGHAKGKEIQKETALAGRRHPAACGCGEILQGGRPAEVAARQRVCGGGHDDGGRARRRQDPEAREPNSIRRCASGRCCRAAGWIVAVAAVRSVLLPLLHGRLRPAAGDAAPRHPHRLRARPDLPGLLLEPEGQRAPPSAGVLRAARDRHRRLALRHRAPSSPASTCLTSSTTCSSASAIRIRSTGSWARS